MIVTALPLEAFMGGVGVGITVAFVCALLTAGANVIRRMAS